MQIHHWCKILKMLVLAVPLLFIVDNPRAEAQGPRMSWSLNTKIGIQPQQIAGRGAPATKEGLVDPIAARIRNKGVPVEVVELSAAGGARSYGLKATSSGTIEEFRRQFNTVIRPELLPLEGATEIHITTKGGQSLSPDIVLPSNPSTGYAWTVTSDSDLTETKSYDLVMHTQGIGVPQHQILHLGGNRNRSGAIKLVYRRPWENPATTSTITLELENIPSRIDLSDPTVPATAAPLPAKKPATTVTAFPYTANGALPSSFDWRDQNINPAIRDQQTCGGCWAFATVGVMEAVLWKNGTPNVDLSEQYLISCNSDGWNCKDGGFTAHMYHQDKVGKSQNVAGGVLESAKPYTNSDSTCTSAYDHPYKLDGWGWAAGSNGSDTNVATTDQVKAAIYNYGPVGVALCAGDSFTNYKSGVFSTDEKSQCNGDANHMVILTGWNDNGGNGYFILRNSWGTAWGISGYMNIGYGISNVGMATSWVTTPSSASAPTISSISPSSLAQGANAQTVTLTGTNLSGATLSIDGSDVSFGSATASATQITVPVTVTSSAATGSRTITVTTTGGSTTATLNITSASTTTAPTISSISPSSLAQGANAQTVTLTGTNLSGATLSISGSGVTLGTATVSATQITVPVTVSSSAATGSRTITVTTTGGSTTVTLNITSSGDNTWTAVESTGTSTDISGLDAATKYEFQVMAICPTCESAYSSSAEFSASSNQTSHTVGQTTVFSGTTNISNRRAVQYTMPSSGTIQSISIYHLAGSKNMILAVYGGDQRPTTLLAKTNAVTVNGSDGWQTVNLANPVHVNGGQKIWLTWVLERNPGILVFKAASNLRAESPDRGFGMPSQFGNSYLGKYDYSIYATYVPD